MSAQINHVADKLKQLSPQRLAEVEDFIDFVAEAAEAFAHESSFDGEQHRFDDAGHDESGGLLVGDRDIAEA